MFGLAFAPGEPGDNSIEEGEEGEADGGADVEAVELVGDEGDEQGDHGRVGPDLVAEQSDDEGDLGKPVAEEVDGGEQGRLVRQTAGRA